MLRIALVVLFFFGTIANSGASTVVSADWKISGDQLISRDTNTGLEWLDLTVTANRSYNDVSQNLGAGGEFEGFHVASVAEVSQFWTDFGIPAIGNFFQDPTPITEVLSRIGLLFCCASGSYSYGFTSDYVDFQGRVTGFLDDGERLGGLAEFYPGGGAADTLALPYIGTYLIRDSLREVSEPSSLLILLLALLLLGLIRGPLSFRNLLRFHKLR